MFRRIATRRAAAAASTTGSSKVEAPADGAGTAAAYTPADSSRSASWLSQDTTLFGRIRNRYRKEMRLGWNSPFVIMGYFGAVIYVVYRLFHGYIKPWKLQQAEREFHLKVPFLDSHNAAFGIQPSRVVHEEPGTVLGEINIDRPIVVAKDRMELAKEPTDMIVMQIREFDPESGKDIFLRSTHCIPLEAAAVPGKTTDAKRGASKVLTQKEQEDLERQTAARHVGESLIHAIIRCTAIGPRGNCIANPTTVEQEYVRKMLTALGAIHMLRHPKHNTAPLRTSQAVEMKADVLVLGLGGGGALPSFLNRHMPHYILDVIEPDGAVLRLARNFLGFRDGSGMHVNIADPAEFVRRTINVDVRKNRYDAVFMDCIDEKGRIPAHLTRLEFLSNLRQTLSDRAVACVVIPNHDEAAFSNAVANWRMAFDGRSVLLMHCRSSPHTVLMTFMDSSGKGIQRFGSVSSYIDYREVMKSLLSHHGSRLPASLLHEVEEETFQQVLPGQRFSFRRVNIEEERKRQLRVDRGYEK